MFMRYFGGGIGHLNQGSHWQIASGEMDDMDVDSSEEQNERMTEVDHNLEIHVLERLADEASQDQAGGREEAPDNVEWSDDDSDDYSNSGESDHSDDEEDNDDGLGPEDGEDVSDGNHGYGAF
jgi:hypothetical protein